MSIAKELNTGKLTDRQFEIFIQKVNKAGPIPDQENPHYKGLDSCWIWNDAKDWQGYGRFYLDRRTPRLAHRVSWSIRNGTIPQGLCVLHRCDNPSCVNPDHLWLGTVTENNNDCTAKDRRLKGSQQKNSKLDEIKVRQIRQKYCEGIFQTTLAIEYGVSVMTISRVVRKKVWGWVD